MTLKQLNDLSWKLIPAAVLFVLAAAWWRARSSRRAPATEGEQSERWVWQRNGQVDGPRLASWRIRRALRSYAELVPWTGSYESWTEDQQKVSGRQYRKVRRLWNDIADALDWPSVFEHYIVTPEARIIVVSAKERPDDAEQSRKLAVLRIRNHRSRVELRPVEDAPELLELVITDVRTTPIQHEVVPERVDRVSTTVNGETTWRNERVRDERRLYVVTGQRFTSLYDEDATWTDVPDPETADEAYTPGATIAVRHSPSPAREPLRGAMGGREGERDPAPNRDSAEPVSVTTRQHEVLRALLGEGLSVSALAARQGCAWGVAKRRLERLAGLGLVERVAADRWELTSSARELLGVPVAPSPWPAPVPEEAP